MDAISHIIPTAGQAAHVIGIAAFAIFGAIIVDMIFGDPKNRYHPTAWAGALMAWLVPMFAGRGLRCERAGGTIVVLATVAATAAALLGISHIIMHAVNLHQYLLFVPPYIITYDMDASPVYVVIYVAASCILLKCTIAIRGMQEHAFLITAALNGKIDHARARLSMIVKRDTASLDRQHIISGTIESIGESTADGVAGPLFYYGFFGLFGAFTYRVINTADSMVGYKSRMLRNIGWFAAHADTIATYVPARLAAACMIVAAFLLRYDWRMSYHIMRRDHALTQSRNSGYVMAAMAGALRVRLEKKGYYTIHSDGRPPRIQDVGRSILLLKCTILVFACCMCVPLSLSGVIIASVVSMIIAGGWF